MKLDAYPNNKRVEVRHISGVPGSTYALPGVPFGLSGKVEHTRSAGVHVANSGLLVVLVELLRTIDQFRSVRCITETSRTHVKLVIGGWLNGTILRESLN